MRLGIQSSKVCKLYFNRKDRTAEIIIEELDNGYRTAQGTQTEK
jgi:hypothetical protein